MLMSRQAGMLQSNMLLIDVCMSLGRKFSGELLNLPLDVLLL